MTSLATPTELVTFLDYPDATQAADRVELVLDLVSAAIRATIGWTDAEPSPVPVAVKGVCLRYAATLYDNPTGDRAHTVGRTLTTHGLQPALAADPELAPFRQVAIA